MTEITGYSWKEIKDKNLDLIVTAEDFEKILPEIGFEVDKTGILIDKETGKPATTNKGVEINLKRDKDVVLFAGSLEFAKNLAGFSDILAKHGLLKIVEKKER